MFPLFGIFEPQTGLEANSTEAPRKKSFFGSPVDPAADASAAEADALFLTGKTPEPAERQARERKGGPPCP